MHCIQNIVFYLHSIIFPVLHFLFKKLSFFCLFLSIPGSIRLFMQKKYSQNAVTV